MKITSDVESPVTGGSDYRFEGCEFRGIAIEKHARVDYVWFCGVCGEDN